MSENPYSNSTQSPRNECVEPLSDPKDAKLEQELLSVVWESLGNGGAKLLITPTTPFRDQQTTEPLERDTPDVTMTQE